MISMRIESALRCSGGQSSRAEMISSAVIPSISLSSRYIAISDFDSCDRLRLVDDEKGLLLLLLGVLQLIDLPGRSGVLVIEEVGVTDA